MTRPSLASCQFRLTASICAMGLVTSGCRPKEKAPEPPASPPQSTAADEHANHPADGWVALETLAPGKWVAIEGAADLGWDAESHVMRIGIGADLNGVRWTGALPALPYIMELEARRMDGSDFFCGLTFPVRSGKECVTLIVGGWGGSLVGISSIDGLDASENSTGSRYEFEDQRWYRIRVEVGEERLQAWIDGRQVVDATTENQRLSLRVGPIEACAPFGLATWMTTAEVRGMRWRKLGD